MKRSMLIGALVVVILAIAIAYILIFNPSTNNQITSRYTTATANGSSPSGSSGTAYSIGTASNPSAGTYLVNASGYTLYTFSLYAYTHYSNVSCTGSCLDAWPVFYAGNMTVQSGLNTSKFGTITRTDGKMQTTYKGHPLFLHRSDTKPGEIATSTGPLFEVATV